MHCMTKNIIFVALFYISSHKWKVIHMFTFIFYQTIFTVSFYHIVCIVFLYAATMFMLNFL